MIGICSLVLFESSREMDSILTISRWVLDRYAIHNQIRQAKEILTIIAKSKLIANGEAKCSSDDSSKDTEGHSPEEGADAYNQSAPRIAGNLTKVRPHGCQKAVATYDVIVASCYPGTYGEIITLTAGQKIHLCSAHSVQSLAD